jgi:hypothetical protein
MGQVQVWCTDLDHGIKTAAWYPLEGESKGASSTTSIVTTSQSEIAGSSSSSSKDKSKEKGNSKGKGKESIAKKPTKSDHSVNRGEIQLELSWAAGIDPVRLALEKASLLII